MENLITAILMVALQDYLRGEISRDEALQSLAHWKGKSFAQYTLAKLDRDSEAQSRVMAWALG